MQIYGIRTPASQLNGAFNIIYQRSFDKAITLINANNVQFPTFNENIVSDINISSFYNT